MPPRRRRCVRRKCPSKRRVAPVTSGAYRRRRARRYHRRTGGMGEAIGQALLQMAPQILNATGQSINGIIDIWKKK